MFHTSGDDVIALFEYAKERDIQRFRTVLGKGDLVEPVTVEVRIEGVSAIFHELCGGERKLMPAPAGVGAYLDRRGESRLYAVGFSTARGGVIKINHHITSYTVVFIEYSIHKRRRI
jgi:hypothetical protein